MDDQIYIREKVQEEDIELDNEDLVMLQEEENSEENKESENKESTQKEDS